MLRPERAQANRQLMRVIFVLTRLLAHAVQTLAQAVALSQQQLAELFQTSRTNVVEHIGNIYAEGELDDAEAVMVIRKEIKKRQDSVASYEQAKREDLADIEKAEIAVLEKYLPVGLTADEISALVEKVIAELPRQGLPVTSENSE